MPLIASEIKSRDHLIRKRAVVKTTLTNFKTFLETTGPSPEPSALKARLERVAISFATLEDITSSLHALEPEANHYAEQEKLEEEYTELLAKGYALQDKVTQLAAGASGSQTSTRSSPNPFTPQQQNTLARLPEQPLPKFDGKYEDWLSFEDDFQSSIGRRQGLSDTDRLKYLRSCLSGEPLRLVRQFETTDAGYQSAWTLLKKTFEDKGRIRERHITEIFNIPALQRESASELCQLINTVELHCSALKSLAEDNFSTMMLCIVLSKIDKNTRKLWRMSLKDGELPTYAELISFLRRMVISTDEPVITFKSEKSNNLGKSRETSTNSNSNNQARGGRPTRSFVTSATTECPICKENHPLFQCSEFRKLSPKERFQAANRASLCINCLRPGHGVKQCTSAFTCKTCHNRHHTLLHFVEPSKATSEANGNASVRTSQS